MIGAAGALSRRFAVTFFTDFAALSKAEKLTDATDLAAMILATSAPAKGQLPWLKLARFGNGRTSKGSLRHDRNLIAISGVEADYDGERIGFDEAVEIAEKAGLATLIYTSPSHTQPAPRWRVLCPTAREHPPAARKHLLGRLNGLYRGVFSHESWTLSQAYYFGAVAHSAGHRVEVVDGEPIDALDELDQIAIGPPATSRRTAEGPSGGSAGDDAELIRRIVTGEGLHVELTALAARYIGRGLDARSVGDVLRGLMLATPENARDQRWRDRYRSIPALVASAGDKFAPEAARRRAIARLTHDLVRQRCGGDEIKAAILAEAGRLELAPDTAVAIGAGILRDVRGRHV